MSYPIILLTILALLLSPASSSAQRTLPVDGGRITSPVGWRVDPFGSGRMVYHRGTDIAVSEGTPVHAVGKGTVFFAGPYKGYGNLVAINHGNGSMSLYGHNSVLKVSPGDRVDDSTVIALSGNTGRSTGPHVHYEIRQIADYNRDRQARLNKDLKAAVATSIHSLVEGLVNGQGGDGELQLPDDIDE